MLSVPGVQSAHAVVHKSDSGAEQLLALITPEEQSLVDEASRVAEARLPAHMRPVGYFLAHTTPRSTAGKADRRAIAKLVATLFSEAQSIAETKEDAGSDIDPEILKTVVKLVAETAELEEGAISLNASFISLGIDSLRGVRFLTLAREAGFKSLAILDVVRVMSFLDALAHMEIYISYKTRHLCIFLGGSWRVKTKTTIPILLLSMSKFWSGSR